MLCFSGLDLIGGLLTGALRRGVTYLAVGTGLPAWDGAAPPAPDRTRTALVAEVWRVPLTATEDVRYAAGVLDVRASLGPGMATGPLREVGLFGGDASALPGSGLLVAHKAHDRIDKGPADTVPRELRLTLPAGLLPGARDLIGGLLAGSPGLTGVTVAALGSDGSPSEAATALVDETYRALLAPPDLAYDHASHSLVATLRLGIGEGPVTVAEAGLFGGAATTAPGSGLLLQRQTFAPIDRSAPRQLVRRFVISLVAPNPVLVPDVVGSSRDAATVAVAGAGLAVTAVVPADGAGASEGSVLRQTPIAGTAVPEGTGVSLTVAAAVTVPVPGVVGLPLATAEAALTLVGLVVGATHEQETDAARGTVTATDPAPGTRVVPATAVTLSVATPHVRGVPGVLGRTLPAAQLVLGVAGFQLSPPPYTVVESGSSVGSVVAQFPAAGVQTPVDEPVQVTLAAPFGVAVPDVRGLTPDGAVAALRAAADPVLRGLGQPPDPPGLTLGATSTRPAQSQEKVGTIVGQTPAPGERVPLYAAVQAVVAGLANAAVPDLQGLELGPATAALAGAGFALGVVAHRAVDVGVGEVVGQDPSAGTVWPPGGRVGVSVGVPVMVTVPDLTALDQAAATEGLASRGLTLGDVTAVATGPGISPGRVLTQIPQAGTSAAKGTSVAVSIAAGMPDLRGRTQADAVAMVEALGLTAVVTQQPSPATPGTVVAQDPAPGAATMAGQQAKVVVAVPPPVTVPDVKGTQFPVAQQQFTALGLVLVADGSQPDGTVPAGAVLSLAPPAGTSVATGTTVTATLAVAPPVMVVVPTLTGMTLSQARAAAAAVQLSVTVTDNQPMPGTPADTVLAQAPPAGSQAQTGSSISVVVASLDTSVLVPDVRMLDQATAQATASKAGLGFAVTSSLLSAGPAGVVLSQDPPPGVRVPAGAVLGVVTSLAAALVADAVGQDFGSASAMLQRQGFVVRGVPRRIVDGDGTVISQSPTAGTLAAVGSGVTLVYTIPLIVRPPGKLPPLTTPPLGPIGPVVERGGPVIGRSVERLPGLPPDLQPGG